MSAIPKCNMRNKTLFCKNPVVYYMESFSNNPCDRNSILWMAPLDLGVDMMATTLTLSKCVLGTASVSLLACYTSWSTITGNIGNKWVN